MIQKNPLRFSIRAEHREKHEDQITFFKNLCVVLTVWKMTEDSRSNECHRLLTQGTVCSSDADLHALGCTLETDLNFE